MVPDPDYNALTKYDNGTDNDSQDGRRADERHRHFLLSVDALGASIAFVALTLITFVRIDAVAIVTQTWKLEAFVDVLAYIGGTLSDEASTWRTPGEKITPV